MNKFFKISSKKCNFLLNLNIIPELTEYKNESESMIEFITKVYEEYKRYEIYDEINKKANGFLLKIFEKITSSNFIEYQSAQINIFREIKNHSKFSITVYPHENLVNKNKLMKLIYDDLEYIYNINYNITEGHAFIIVNDFIDNKKYKNIYECREKEILKFINKLNEIHNLKNNYLHDVCKINENKLDIIYDAPNFNSEEFEKKGETKYFRLLHYFGIGIKHHIANDSDWIIAYFTFSKRFINEEIRNILHVVIERKNMNILVFKKENNELDKRDGNKIGTGIYLIQDFNKADKYAGTFNINGKKYKILLMAKVKKDKIKESENKKGLWIVDKEFVKIYRIIFKEDIEINDIPF